jgi:hypothetical protein
LDHLTNNDETASGFDDGLSFLKSEQEKLVDKHNREQKLEMNILQNSSRLNRNKNPFNSSRPTVEEAFQQDLNTRFKMPSINEASDYEGPFKHKKALIVGSRVYSRRS